MTKDLLIKYRSFKNTNYEISNIEFEILQAKLKLSFVLNDEQLKYFEEYDKLNLLLLSKKEYMFMRFILEELNPK